MLLKTRLVVWFVVCLVISNIFFFEILSKLPRWLSPEGLQRYGVFHWGVLALCLVWLWLRRSDISSRMLPSGFSPLFVVSGLALVGLSVFLPKSDGFLFFPLLLGWLGIFAVLFGSASKTPAILLGVYGFSVGFPIVMKVWLGEPSAVLATNTVAATTSVLGLPVVGEGQLLHLTSTTGQAISALVSAGCAGYITIGIFIALFVLMTLDSGLPLGKAWHLFLIGLLGTWLQNIVRILLTIGAGYYWGFDALETMHLNSAYFIFPLWYGFFAYIYMKQVVSIRVAKREVPV